MTLFLCGIGAYFKSIEAVKISNLYGTTAFHVAACEREADELERVEHTTAVKPSESCHTLLTKWVSVSNRGSSLSLQPPLKPRRLTNQAVNQRPDVVLSLCYVTEFGLSR